MNPMSNDPEIREQLNRIERCLMGDEEMGQFGLVSRVNNHNARIKKLELWVFRIMAAAGGVSTAFLIVYKVVTEFLK